MLDEHHRDSVVAHRTHELADLRRLLGVHAGRGLVEQDQAGPGGQGPRDLDPTLGAVGQLVGQLAPFGHTDPVEQRGGALLALAPLAPLPRGEQQAAQRPRPAIGVHAGDDLVEHAEAAEQPDVLVGPGDALPADGVRAVARDLGVLEDDGALVGTVEAGDQVEQAGLARAVGAHQAHHGAGGHAQGDAVNGLDPAEVLGDVLEVQQRAAEGPGAHRAASCNVGSMTGVCWEPRRRRRGSRRCGSTRPRGSQTMITTSSAPVISSSMSPM